MRSKLLSESDGVSPAVVLNSGAEAFRSISDFAAQKKRHSRLGGCNGSVQSTSVDWFYLGWKIACPSHDRRSDTSAGSSMWAGSSGGRSSPSGAWGAYPAGALAPRDRLELREFGWLSKNIGFARYGTIRRTVSRQLRLKRDFILPADAPMPLAAIVDRRRFSQ
jgi:hypothetical protein